ncbi:MAG: hypothetical protein HKN70_12940, partial [Gammaproteobacteria bacterium]|nr:hypothetical protein [Gammaproteobacteria bacterium]
MKPNFIYAICSLQSVVTVVLLALAQATQAAEPKELVIEQVVVSYDFEAGEGGATIFGRNFPDFEKLRVALAGSEVGIEVLAASDAHVDIRLPEDLIVGEYRLTLYKAKEGSVCKRSPSRNCDEYDLTISDVEQRLTGLELFLLDCRNIPIDERGQTCKLVFATSEAYTGSLGGL